MNKVIQFNSESRTNLKIGIDTLANAVKVTLGPKGRNVIIDKNYGGPHVTKDGVSVAKEVYLSDPVQDLGAQLLREVASKTCDDAGDGTTTATVLAQAIINDGIKCLAAGANPIDIKRGIDKAVSEVVKYIRSNATKIDANNLAQIENIATVSANNDKAIGKLIAEAVEAVKTTGVITVDVAKGSDTTVEILKGLQLESGYISPYMVSDNERMINEMVNPYILIVNRSISNIKEFLEILEYSARNGHPLLIIADNIDPEPLSTIVMNKVKGTINVCVIKSPGFGDTRRDLLLDIAVSTGATPVLDNVDGRIYNPKILGSAEKVTITRDKTTIINGKGSSEAIQEHIKSLEGKEGTEERIAHLSTGVAVIYVGAPSEVEMKEKKDRVDDAVCATRAALEEGIVPGGGTIYIKAQDIKVSADNEDEQMGINIIKKALLAPICQIATNAGKDGLVIANHVYESGVGYNAHTGQYEDLLKAGVIDPAKVTRVALENAASVAGMFLTTECVIANGRE